jgi:hypothetical protein
MIMRALGTVVLAALLFGGRVAQARTGGEARDAFEEGAASFRLGKYQAAIEAWERGYKLRPDPVFLFNIAQAYRQADDGAHALDYYRSYLAAAPAAANRAEVERRIEQLQAGTSPATVASADAGSFALPPSSPPPPPAATETLQESSPRAHGRIELGADVGLALWLSGPPRDTLPSVAVTVRGDAQLWQRGRLAVRLGGAVGYTFVREASATDHFVSLRLLPTLRVRLTVQRWFLDATPAVGAEIVAGIPGGSPLLRAGATPRTIGAFELRPEVALSVLATRHLLLRAAAAAVIAPTGDDGLLATATLARVELGLSALVRFP